MVNEQKKKTAQISSVGADEQRSISQKNNITIPDSDRKNNPAEGDFEEFYRQIQRMQDPAYLHTVADGAGVPGKVCSSRKPALYRSIHPCRSAQNWQVFSGGTVPIISVREDLFGGIRYSREQCFTWRWRMTKVACSVECTECLVWKGQAPFKARRSRRSQRYDTMSTPQITVATVATVAEQKLGRHFAISFSRRTLHFRVFYINKRDERFAHPYASK